MKNTLATIAIAAAMIFSTQGAFADDPAAWNQIKIEAGQKLFEASCRRCHAVDAEDRQSYGPLLEGVVGRKAGTFEGYAYSKAMAGSGIVWTPAALRAWMEDNDGFMPGTKMRHVGIEDATVQDFILAYLKSVSG
jgi:cytochrome c